MPDLVTEIVAQLETRPDDWEQIAADTGVSLSMIEKLGRRAYKSSPTYGKLSALSEWLRRHPRRAGPAKARAAA